MPRRRRCQLLVDLAPVGFLILSRCWRKTSGSLFIGSLALEHPQRREHVANGEGWLCTNVAAVPRLLSTIVLNSMLHVTAITARCCC